jgi:hypothetical protein
MAVVMVGLLREDVSFLLFVMSGPPYTAWLPRDQLGNVEGVGGWSGHNAVALY